MPNTKVELPSIAELTSSARSTKNSHGAIPSISFPHSATPKHSVFSSPPPNSYRHTPYTVASHYIPPPPPPAVASHPQVSSYQYISQNNSIQSLPSISPQASYHPVFFGLSPSVTSPPQFITPGSIEQSPIYNIPEVINKPMDECHRCGTTETPEWRRGPNGLRTLCNACGLFHAKLVKRKGAAVAAEEVLKNKVCKGKNGRRVTIKRSSFDQAKAKVAESHVTEIPPISPAVDTKNSRYIPISTEVSQPMLKQEYTKQMSSVPFANSSRIEMLPQSFGYSGASIPLLRH